MEYGSLDHTHRAYMRDFLQTYYSGRADFNDRIAVSDEMFHKAIVPGYTEIGAAYMAYMQSGRRMLDVVSQLSDFAFNGLSNVRSFLEFACGYGRFTRHLVMACPRSRIVASDIYRGAVDWQHEQHGIPGIYSTPEPTDYSLVASFDVIFVGSLFSHLPEPLFEKWLERLYRMLSPNGVIAFSVHDFHLIASRDQQEAFRYEKHSESASLSHAIYGMTYVSEEYVRDVIQRVCPGSGGHYRCFSKGLYENQDLYVVSRNTEHDWSGFELLVSPVGGKTFCNVEGDKIAASGWALNLNHGGRLDTADIYVDNVHIQTIPTVLDTSGVIEKYFPGVQSSPVRCDVRLSRSEVPEGGVLKCRFSSAPKRFFDVHLGVLE